MEQISLTTSILAVLGIIFFISWIMTLVKQLKKKRYTWFVLTLIIPFVSLIYWIWEAFN